MPQEKTAVDFSENEFAQIVYDETLTVDEKKSAITAELLFDITRPQESLAHMQEFLALRDHLAAEKERLIKEIASVSLGDVFGKKAEKEEKPADGAKNVTDTVFGFLNAAKDLGANVAGNVAKISKGLDALVQAKGEVVSAYDILEQAAAEAARQNKEEAEKLVAAINQYDEGLTSAFAVEPGVLQNIVSGGGRFLEQASKAMQPEQLGKTVAQAGGVVAKTTGKAVARGTAKVVIGAAKGLMD